MNSSTRDARRADWPRPTRRQLLSNQFRTALFNTIVLSGAAAIVGQFLFSFLAYVLVRTR